MAKDRAADVAGPIEPYVAPPEAFPQYFQWYTAGSMEDMRFRFTSKLRETMRVWRILLENELRAEGQTRARWEALLVIALSGGRSTQKSLANRLRIESPTLVRLLDKLEQDGLIQRVQGTADRRSNLIQPTRKGTALVKKLVKRTDALRAYILEGWTIDEMNDGIALFDRLIEKSTRKRSPPSA